MELQDYVKTLRQRLGVIIFSVIAVTAIALAMSVTQKPTYEGVALVGVSFQDPGLAALGGMQSEQTYQYGRDFVQTQVEAIQSARIAELVIRKLRLRDSVAGLSERVTVTADTGTSNISIRAVDRSASGAARVANAYAEAFVEDSREAKASNIRAAGDDVERRLKETQDQIVDLESKRDLSSTDKVKLSSAKTRYASLSDKLEQLRIAEQLATGPGSVIASATPNADPISPRPVRDATLGLSMGLLVGLGAAFLFERLDTGVKSATELAEIYGAPVLANIPEEKGRKADLARLTLKERAGTPAAEAYRMLRNNLDFVNFDKGTKAVLVTSSVPGQGKSTVAANLAAVLSLAGYRVVLVVCDFHRAAADEYFELQKSTGLSNVLAGTTELWAALRPAPGFTNLAVLSAGPLPPNPSELLGSAGMGRVVTDLRAKFDWVILDSAPVLAAADALAVGRWVDGMLVVGRIGLSKRDTEAAGRDQLSNVGARVLGLAVWGPNVASPALGYYGYNHTSPQ